LDALVQGMIARGSERRTRRSASGLERDGEPGESRRAGGKVVADEAGMRPVKAHGRSRVDRACRPAAARRVVGPLAERFKEGPEVMRQIRRTRDDRSCRQSKVSRPPVQALYRSSRCSRNQRRGSEILVARIDQARSRASRQLGLRSP